MKQKYPYVPEERPINGDQIPHYLSVDNEEAALSSKDENARVNSSQIDVNNNGSAPYSPMTAMDERAGEAPSDDFNEAKENKQLSIELMKQLVKKVGFFQLNLGIVYFLEYMCLTSFAERYVAKMVETHPERRDEYLYKHGYVIFSFCY